MKQLPCVVIAIAIILTLGFIIQYLVWGFTGQLPVSSRSRDVEIWANRDCAKRGESITLRATVTNRTNSEWVAEITNEPIFDIVVGTREETKRWSDTNQLTSDETPFRLKPGESKTISMDWVAPESAYGPTYAYAPFRFPHSYSPGGQPSIDLWVATCPHSWVIGP